ncbi:outer membrane heme receptor [Bordetella pertussis]|nr:outer membrane heme receptor [Bordetella pertussis]
MGKDENTGQHLNSVPPLKAILGLGYQRDEWGIDAMLTAATRRDDVQYPEASASARYADFQAPGYGVVDLSAYWRPAAVKGLQLQAACSTCSTRNTGKPSTCPRRVPLRFRDR